VVWATTAAQLTCVLRDGQGAAYGAVQVSRLRRCGSARIVNAWRGGLPSYHLEGGTARNIFFGPYTYIYIFNLKRFCRAQLHLSMCMSGRLRGLVGFAGNLLAHSLCLDLRGEEPRRFHEGVGGVAGECAVRVEADCGE